MATRSRRAASTSLARLGDWRLIRTVVLIGSVTEYRPFPCLDGHRYCGCVGLSSCTAVRCWNGRRLKREREAGQVCADPFDRPLQVLRYTASDCPNCQHAVDLKVSSELRSAAGRSIDRWTICELNLWAGPASLYNLLNHRAPVKYTGHCPSFLQTPPEQMRPELARQREADRERARARRARLKEVRERPRAAAVSG